MVQSELLPAVATPIHQQQPIIACRRLAPPVGALTWWDPVKFLLNLCQNCFQLLFWVRVSTFVRLTSFCGFLVAPPLCLSLAVKTPPPHQVLPWWRPVTSWSPASLPSGWNLLQDYRKGESWFNSVRERSRTPIVPLHAEDGDVFTDWTDQNKDQFWRVLVKTLIMNFISTSEKLYLKHPESVDILTLPPPCLTSWHCCPRASLWTVLFVQAPRCIYLVK